MEYLMTYGWAILVIAVVLGVLYSLGIFSPSNFAPKAQPGSCQVFRPNGPATSYNINLEGVCSDELPEYVGEFMANSMLTVPYNRLFFSNPNAVTVSAWIYLPSSLPAPYRGIIGFAACCVSGAYDMIIEVNQPHVGFEVVSSTGTRYYENPNVENPTGTWVNYIGTYNGTSGNVTVYIDGKRYTSNGNPANVISGVTNNLIIGGGNGATEFPGAIANVQIYNISVGSTAADYLYNEGIGGAPVDLQHLVGWWPLNGNANDYSGNNNNGEPIYVSYSGTWQGGYTSP